MKCRKYYVKLAFVCREIYNGIGVIPPYKKDDKNSKIAITSLLRHVTMVPKLNMFHREEKNILLSIAFCLSLSILANLHSSKMKSSLPFSIFTLYDFYTPLY